jgi:large subunit ribosomal protein L18
MSLTKPERRQRIRFKLETISGTATNPRLSVFRVTKKFMLNLLMT